MNVILMDHILKTQIVITGYTDQLKSRVTVWPLRPVDFAVTLIFFGLNPLGKVSSPFKC